MAVNNQININLDAKDNASKKFDKLKKSSTGLGGSLKKLGGPLKAVGIGIGVIGGAAVLAGKKFVSMANDQIRVETALEAVLKSTKNAAGLTSDEIKNMASSLQQVTTIGDETILAGQNMLLTFTQIGKDVFPQATETLLDMATAMNRGMTPSAEQLSAQAIQLGKALNDPIIGVTALSRVGVKFTDEQKEQIKTLAESGRVMEAQKIILAELGTEFGGAARAQAETFEGKMQQLSNTLGDVQEEIGMGLIPVIMELVDEYRPVILEFANSLKVWFQNKENIDSLIESVKTTIAVFKTIGTIIGFVITVFTKLGELIGFIAFDMVQKMTQLGESFISLGETIAGVWRGVKDVTISIFNAIGEIISGVIDAIVGKFTRAFERIKAIVNSIKRIGGKISGAVSGAVSSVRGAISGTKANGGPVTAGKSFLVGERGPEVFTPIENGNIAPNGAGAEININFGGVTITDQADENRLVNKIKQALTDDMKMYKNFGIS